MDYSKTVIPIMKQTQDLLMNGWGSAGIIKTKSEPLAIVTDLDIKVAEFVSKRLAESYPDIVFVDEERGGDRTARRFWLMDPIDGTQAYVRGLPFCTSMIALIEDGIVVFGAIYDFTQDIMYWAQQGMGAYKNNERIHVSSRRLNEAHVCWGSDISKEKNLRIFQSLFARCATVKTLASGYELSRIAEGKLDALITFDSFGEDYDLAPGSLLVKEAGGIVTNLGSREYNYHNTDIIAANPTIYHELTDGHKALFPTGI